VFQWGGGGWGRIFLQLSSWCRLHKARRRRGAPIQVCGKMTKRFTWERGDRLDFGSLSGRVSYMLARS
jgi:hypothetical protein